MGQRGMTDYYRSMLEKGQEYQDFVLRKFYDQGMVITQFASMKNQYDEGETRFGWEIKFDMNYSKTGNLYIETAEKSHPLNPKYVDSGIYRGDNSWMYCIGDKNRLFMFGVKQLRIMHAQNIYRNVTISTSKGFLLPVDKAKNGLCIHIFEFESSADNTNVIIGINKRINGQIDMFRD